MEVENLLRVRNEYLSKKYLGMPSDVGNSKNGPFKYLKDRAWNKVNGSMEKLLSVGGNDVLIKSIAQAILVYSMSCFKIPKGLCHHINSEILMGWQERRAQN